MKCQIALLLGKKVSVTRNNKFRLIWAIFIELYIPCPVINHPMQLEYSHTVLADLVVGVEVE